MIAVLLAAILGILAGWYAHRLHIRPTVRSLVALTEAQDAALIAIPEREVEHRAEVAAWYRERRDKQVDRIDRYFLDQRRAAA